MILDTSPRIVIVDDSEDDYLLISRQIKRQLPQAKVCHAMDFQALLHVLEDGIDLVVCDYAMQDLTHEQVVDLVSGYQPEIPLVLMSGMAGEALGVRAMQSGVRDYVEKSKPERLIPVIVRELNTRKLHSAVRTLQQAQADAAGRDAQTGLLNPLGFQNTLAEGLAAGNLGAAWVLTVGLGRGLRKLGGEESALNKRLQAELTERIHNTFDVQHLCKWNDTLYVALLPHHFLGLVENLLEQAQWLLDVEQQLNRGLLLGHSVVSPDLRLGLARVEQDGVNAETLIAHAQAVATVLRKQNLPWVDALTAPVHTQARRRICIQTGLSQGIERDELTLEFQPVEDLRTRKVVGLEALVRWSHPELGLVMPDEFIGVAEDSGLIESLGLWVIRKASRYTLKLHALGHQVWCAVNCSAGQLLKPEFTSEAAEHIAREGLTPQWIEFEITETAAIEDMDTSVNALNRLRSMGCKVAMDDFGTGYASLNYLRRLPIDVLKIDKGFVADLMDSERSQKIVKAVIDLAHALGLTVHAEGIENQAQRQCLTDMGCDRLQGYLVSRPLAWDALLPWLDGQLAGQGSVA